MWQVGDVGGNSYKALTTDLLYDANPGIGLTICADVHQPGAFAVKCTILVQEQLAHMRLILNKGATHSMRKSRFSILGVALAIATFASAFVVSIVSAAPVRQATTPTPATFTAGMLLQIAPGVPFVWLRSLPASNATVIDTAQSGEFLIVASPAPQSDGTQWWWAVRRGSGSVTGWVEQKSLVPAIAPTATATIVGPTRSPAAAWTGGTALTLAPGVPFVWLRAGATSGALARATAYPGAFLTVRDANPNWDGVQYWWLVNFPALNVYGWVEQKSLMVSAVATPTTTPTAAGTIAPTSTPIPPGSAATWGIPSVVRVRAAVPFVWLRATPASNGTVRGTILSGGLLLANGAPQYDGVQYWWPVQASATLSGWVEQNSLELLISIGGAPSASGSNSSDNSVQPPNGAIATPTATASS